MPESDDGLDAATETTEEDLEDVQFNDEPHPSGVSHARVSLWTDGDAPGDGQPSESVSVPVRDGKRYAINGETVDAETWIVEFVMSHLGGKCDCLEDGDE